jgi:hypothetical protein
MQFLGSGARAQDSQQKSIFKKKIEESDHLLHQFDKDEPEPSRRHQK